MESKIMIRMDYDKKEPFIQIEYNHSSDERDRMIGAFLDQMGGQICFTKFGYAEFQTTIAWSLDHGLKKKGFNTKWQNTKQEFLGMLIYTILGLNGGHTRPCMRLKCNKTKNPVPTCGVFCSYSQKK